MITLKQIRAHAKYLGIPLMGDEVYGGTKNMAISRLQLKNSSKLHGQLSELVAKVNRPCLHALTLGSVHFKLNSFVFGGKLLGIATYFHFYTYYE